MAVVGLNIKKLCTPAYVYLVVSIITIVAMVLQNMGNVNVYCLGEYSCPTSNLTLIFIIKVIYILFWTWVLNLICKSGATNVAWFLVLLPYILFFILIFLFILTPAIYS